MTANPAIIALAAIWLLSVVSLVRGLAEQYVTPMRSWTAHSWTSREIRRLLAILPFFVALLVLASGIYILTSSSYTGADRRWGYAIVGTIAGYWLRGTIR